MLLSSHLTVEASGFSEMHPKIKQCSSAKKTITWNEGKISAKKTKSLTSAKKTGTEKKYF